MNEENPSTDATFDRLLDELHGIQSGQSYAAALEWTSRLRAGLDALESLAVRDAVLNAHLSKTEIASALGITRQTLYNRHKELLGEVTCSRHLTASRSEVGASCSRLVSESVSTGYSRAPHGSRKFFVIVPA